MYNQVAEPKNLQIVGLQNDRWLRGLFGAWSTYLYRFEKFWSGADVPWVYREETHAGLLASAAAEMGTLALVESKTETVSGRAAYLDLWISGQIQQEQLTVEFEIKRWHKNYYKDETMWNQVSELLEQAKDDIDFLARDRGSDRGYALVAVPLLFSQSRWESRRDRSFFIKEAKSSILAPGTMGADFSVIHHASPQTLGGSTTHRTAGVALVGKRCW